MINKLKFLLLMLVAPLCLAQTGAHRISQVLVKGNSINANVGPYAHILVCVANTGCNTGANIYSDQALTQLITQPLIADGSGNYDYYVATPGCYDEQISSPGSQDIFIPNVCPFNGSGGANLTAGAVQFAPTVSTTRAATYTDIGNLFTGTGPCFLNKNGTCSSSTATPAGSTLQVQANIGGSFGVIPFFTVNTSNDSVAARALQGVFSTDTYNTSNNGIATFIASSDCNAVSCSAMIPATSTDTSLAINQAGNSTTNSSLIQDFRYNAIGQFSTNPTASGYNFDNAIQSGFSRETAYTTGSSTNTQGGQQGMFFDGFNAIHAGYVSSDGGCPLSCPKSPYTQAAQWQIDTIYEANNYFNDAGIHSVSAITNYFGGIGDANVNSIRNYYNGGFITTSDEGIHGLAEIQTYSSSDWQGTITTLTDPSHFVASNSQAFATQGPGRFMIDQSATPLLSLQVMANIFPPSINTAPYYGTIVFDSSTPALPVSSVQGHLVTNCTVPIQEGTLASTTCTAHADNGGTYHVTSPTSTDMDLFCAAANYGGDMIFGAQITAAAAKDGSGNQLLTMNIHRSVPAVQSGSQPTTANQGGACGSVVVLNGDTNNTAPGGAYTNGTTLPVIISPNSHTVGYARYNASQVWTGAVTTGSAVRDESIAQVANGDLAPGAFQVINVSRTGNVLTGTINSNGGLGFRALANTFVNVASGCSDSSVNGNLGLITFVSGGTFTVPQTGANTTCSSGMVITLPFHNLQASVLWASEIFDVANHTPGVLPTQMFNFGNYFVGSYQPAFKVGDNIDLPPNYAINGDTLNIQQSMSQPGPMNSITILNGGYSTASGPAISVQFQNTGILNNLGPLGNGGNQVPGDVLDSIGVFNSTISADSQPIQYGINWGFSQFSGNPGFQNFSPLSINNGGNILHFDNIIDGGQWSFQSGNGFHILSLSNNHVTSAVAFDTPSLTFDNFLPSGNVLTPTAIFHECSTKDASGSTCYDNYFVTSLTITQVGTAGTTHYSYYMQLINPNGTSTWGPISSTFTGNATLSTSNYNQISCSALPAGYTANIWNYQITFPSGYTNIGTCTSSSGFVNDQVSPRSPTENEVLSLGGTLNLGEALVNGAGQGFCYTSNNLFTNGFVGPPSAVGCISSVTAGVFSFDTTTLGNGAGTVKASIFNGAVTGVSTAPSGSCTVVEWVFSQDGHATFCNGTTWSTKI